MTQKKRHADIKKSARRLEISAVLAENPTSTAENQRKHAGIFKISRHYTKLVKTTALPHLQIPHQTAQSDLKATPRPPRPHSIYCPLEKNYFPEGTKASYVPSSKKTRISLILRGHLSNCLTLSACRASERR